MKTFERRLAILEASVKAETGCKVAIVANDDEKDITLKKVQELHNNSDCKYDELIIVLVHPGAIPAKEKYIYSNE